MKMQTKVPEITRVSSKGQVVIPTDIRKRFGIREGSIFAISAKNNIIVLKKMNTEMKTEDMKTLKLIEEAWKDIEEGRYKTATPSEFFKEMKKWKK